MDSKAEKWPTSSISSEPTSVADKKSTPVSFLSVGSVTLRAPKDSTSEAKVGSHAITKDGVLYSVSFGPCVAVVGKLKGGGFVLYHSFAEDGIKEFIKPVRDELEEIYVFRKSRESNTSNYARAPILAAQIETESGVSTKCVQVEQYRAIVCDASSTPSRIILAEKYESPAESKAVTFSASAEELSLDSAVDSATEYRAHMDYLAENNTQKYKAVDQVRNLKDFNELVARSSTARDDIIRFLDGASSSPSSTLTRREALGEKLASLEHERNVSEFKSLVSQAESPEQIANFLSDSSPYSDAKRKAVLKDDLLPTFASLADQKAVNHHAVNGLVNVLGKRAINNYIMGPLLALLNPKTADQDLAAAAIRQAVMLVKADRADVFSNKDLKKLINSKPFQKEFFKTERAKTWATWLSATAVVRIAKAHPDAARFLVSQKGFENFSREQKKVLLEKSQGVALDVLESKHRGNIPWATRSWWLGGGGASWQSLIGKHPKVAQKVISNQDIKGVEKLSATKLLAMAKDQPGTAYAVFERFKPKDAKSATSKAGFFGWVSRLFSSNSQEKFTTDQWVQFFKSAGPNVVHMVPSGIFDKFDRAQILEIASQNPGAVEPMHNVISQRTDADMVLMRELGKRLPAEPQVQPPAASALLTSDEQSASSPSASAAASAVSASPTAASASPESLAASRQGPGDKKLKPSAGLSAGGIMSSLTTPAADLTTEADGPSARTVTSSPVSSGREEEERERSSDADAGVDVERREAKLGAGRAQRSSMASIEMTDLSAEKGVTAGAPLSEASALPSFMVDASIAEGSLVSASTSDKGGAGSSSSEEHDGSNGPGF